MKLVNPTDEDLNFFVATKIAGWTHGEVPAPLNCAAFGWRDKAGKPLGERPWFTDSADAVLSLLEGSPYQVEALYCQTTTAWHCTLTGRFTSERQYQSGPQNTFPLAACIVLLRAHGFEVEFTK